MKSQIPVKSMDDNKNNVYKDGIYEGEGQGFKSIIRVRVIVKRNKITKIDIVKQNDTPYYFNMAKGIIEKIIDEQSIEVKHIAGARYSSNGIKNAIKDALGKAKIHSAKAFQNNICVGVDCGFKDKGNIYQSEVLIINNYTQDGKENKVIFNRIPKRVIATNQSVTELLLTLNLEKSIVGTSYMDDYILPELKEKYEKIPILAQKYPSPEVVKRKNPDFIIGWNSAFWGYGLGFVENWNEKGINTFIQRNTLKTQTIDNIYKDIEDIGKIFNVENRAETLIKCIQNCISNIQDKLKDCSNKLIRVLPIEAKGEGEYYTYGNTKLVNDMIEKAGGINLGNGKLWNIADVVYENPDVILVIKYNTQNVLKDEINDFKKIDTLKNINAIKNNKIIEVELADIYPGGIRTGNIIKNFANMFYPEKFNESIN